ncbi:hypothetical protein [uncultured Paracoccus sp.]|nr:hypothetical protein [uncultured Paracoccus sp.]
MSSLSQAIPAPSPVTPLTRTGAATAPPGVAEEVEEYGSMTDPECTTGTCCDHPVWLNTARGELGTREVSGRKGSNPRIDEYMRSTDIAASYHHDGTAWCSAFANWVLENTPNPKTPGKNFTGSNSAGSQVWMNWGSDTKAEPFVGALIVIRWSSTGTAGHNTFIVGETPDGKYWWGLGGNQGIANDDSDEGLVVNVAKYRKNSTIRSIRKPPNFNPCDKYKKIPQYTDDEVMAKFGKESGSAQDYNSTR